MATKAQIMANRRNAKKSTGPKTPQGKKTVSQNTIRHGLLTAATLVAGDDPAEFREFAAHIREHHWPDSAMEAALVACITDCMWRLQRLTKVEAGAFAPVSEPAYDADVQKLGLDPFDIPPDKQAESESVNAGAIERLFAFAARGELFVNLQRYETQLERKLSRTIEELERIQFARIHRIHPYQLRHMRQFDPLDSSILAMPIHEGRYPPVKPEPDLSKRDPSRSDVDPSEPQPGVASHDRAEDGPLDQPSSPDLPETEAA